MENSQRELSAASLAILVLIIGAGIYLYTSYVRTQSGMKNGEYMRGDTKEGVANIKVDTALKGINMSAAGGIYYRNNSYEKLCADGILNTSEVEGKWVADMLMDGLGVSNQIEASVKCFASKKRYVVSSKMPSGQKMCVEGVYTSGSNYSVTMGAIADEISMNCKLL